VISLCIAVFLQDEVSLIGRHPVLTVLQCDSAHMLSQSLASPRQFSSQPVRASTKCIFTDFGSDLRQNLFCTSGPRQTSLRYKTVTFEHSYPLKPSRKEQIHSIHICAEKMN
jgi:hypothetical protein